jgi:dicarboxylate transporter 10
MKNLRDDHNPGILSLWTGISASILRQSTYSTARFAIYNYLARKMQVHYDRKKLSMQQTIVCAGVAGGLAGVLGNPTEVFFLISHSNHSSEKMSLIYQL